VAGWHWSPCAALAGSTDTDDNRRNGSRRSAKDSIGTSHSLDGVGQIVKSFWSFGMPPGGREKDNREEKDNHLARLLAYSRDHQFSPSKKSQGQSLVIQSRKGRQCLLRVPVAVHNPSHPTRRTRPSGAIQIKGEEQRASCKVETFQPTPLPNSPPSEWTRHNACSS